MSRSPHYGNLFNAIRLLQILTMNDLQNKMEKETLHPKT